MYVDTFNLVEYVVPIIIVIYHHLPASLYISYLMSKNSTLVLVLFVSYSTINTVFIFILYIYISVDHRH